MVTYRIVDVDGSAWFERIPPCADPRFDHRTCDYWENAERGSKAHRPGWLQVDQPRPAPARPDPGDNPFAPPARRAPFNPFDPAALDQNEAGPPDDLFAVPDDNPFAPVRRVERPMTTAVPRKLALLDRGRVVFGSYAKLLLDGDEPLAYAQFGPLSAYPRAVRLRELYPQLPDAPLPAVITCVSTVGHARREGHGRRLVEAVCDDLSGRGFSAVEAYPDLTGTEDETSAGRPDFWIACGFAVAVDDERFPVMRRELG